MILGICLEKGGLRAAVLDGTKRAPVLVERQKCKNPDHGNLPASASWYETRFDQFLAAYAIEGVSAKIHFTCKKQDDVLNHGFPLGVLALVSHRRNVPFSLFTKRKLQGYATYGLAKGTDPYRWVDALNDGGVYWDDAAKTSVLAAAALL